MILTRQSFSVPFNSLTYVRILLAISVFSLELCLQIIRAPLVFFPMVLSTVSDALVALGRIGTFLSSEELGEPYFVDDSESNKWAVRVEGDFTWETVGKPTTGKFGAIKGGKRNKGPDDKKGEKKGRGKASKQGPVLPTSNPQSGSNDNTQDQVKKDGPEEKPFALNKLSLYIPKGAFIAIVGRVGSGKSSLLQGLVGEMRRVRGEVCFGGTVAYVPQQAWIMNATLRDNVLFGRDNDEQK